MANGLAGAFLIGEEPVPAGTVVSQETTMMLNDTDSAGTWAWHCHILPHAERDDGMFGMVTALVVK